MGTYEPARKMSAASVGQKPGGPGHLRVAPTEPPALTPGGALRRLAAVFVDQMVFGMLMLPLYFVVLFAFKASDPNAGLMATMQSKNALISLVYYVAALPLCFLYFGWFYKNRGGTPGKLALGLRVIDAKTGTHVGYWRAFLRETIGRLIDVMFLAAGLIVGLVRSDKRCFHDLMFGTQVVRKK